MNLDDGNGHIIETGAYSLPRNGATDLHIPGVFVLEFTAPYIESGSELEAIDIASQGSLLELYGAVELLSEARSLCVADLSAETELDLIIKSEEYLSRLGEISEEMLRRSTIQEVVDVVWHMHNDRLSKLLEVLVPEESDDIYKAFVAVESEFKQECLEQIDSDLPNLMWDDEDILEEDIRIITEHLDSLSRALVTYENEQTVLAGNLQGDV